MREKKIIQTSIIGVIANVLLVVAKMIIGLLANAISIVTDAINNFTDVLSSLITIVGTKLSGKKPDKKHPYGHGRIEYLTSLAIALLVIVAGGVAIYEAIKGLIEQTAVVTYTPVSLIVIGLAVLVKVGLGIFFRKRGKELNSQALKASGVDALSDAVLSFSTLAVAIVCFFVPDAASIHLENYLSIVIGGFIVKAGIEIMVETSSQIIGTRADQKLINDIKSVVNSFPEVQGAYDLILNYYGPSRIIGSIHIQVDDDLTAKEIHALTKKIQGICYEKFNIIMTVGIYANNESDPDIKSIKDDLIRIVSSDENILQFHGFYVDRETKLVTFDIIIKAGYEKHEELVEDIKKQISELHPEYKFYVVEDLDISD